MSTAHQIASVAPGSVAELAGIQAGDIITSLNGTNLVDIFDYYYYEDERMNEYELTLFIQEESDPSLYRKFQETHLQRAYTLEEMKKMIEQSGMTYLTAYDAYTRKSPGKKSERICVIAKECGK